MGIPIPILIRSLLLICIGGLGGAANALAQGASPSDNASPVVMPHTEAHRLTADNGRTYTLYVQLPESYSAADSVVYPVLYLTDAEAELLGMFTGINYFLRFTGVVPDVILVGVADGGIPEHFQIRRLDYTPTVQPPANNPSGGAAEFLGFLHDQAMPFIEGRYRADPADRGIWGHSLGGLFAAYALLNSPGTFHRYLISSPTLTYDDRLLVRQAASHAETHDRLPARIYSAFGAEEPVSGIEAWEAFFAALTGASYADLRVTTALVPEANHATVMPIAFMRGMEAVYGLRPIAAVLYPVIAAHGVEEAKRLYHHLRQTEPEEYNFSESQLNNLGYRLLGDDKTAEAIEVFRLNVEAYPHSSNVYDSLGEAYLMAGDRARAAANYRRLLELDPENTNAAEVLRGLGVDPE